MSRNQKTPSSRPSRRPVLPRRLYSLRTFFSYLSSFLFYILSLFPPENQIFLFYKNALKTSSLYYLIINLPLLLTLSLSAQDHNLFFSLPVSFCYAQIWLLLDQELIFRFSWTYPSSFDLKN